jgi:hypothetical protein
MKQKSVFSQTDIDILVDSMKKVFPTKDDLKDMRSQITDDIDGKLKIQKRDLLDEIDIKLKKQKDDIVKDVADLTADTLIPMFDEHDTQIARLEKHVGLSQLTG